MVVADARVVALAMVAVMVMEAKKITSTTAGPAGSTNFHRGRCPSTDNRHTSSRAHH